MKRGLFHLAFPLSIIWSLSSVESKLMSSVCQQLWLNGQWKSICSRNQTETKSQVRMCTSTGAVGKGIGQRVWWWCPEIAPISCDRGFHGHTWPGPDLAGTPRLEQIS
jgi:hypothetical protein